MTDSPTTHSPEPATSGPAASGPVAAKTQKRRRLASWAVLGTLAVGLVGAGIFTTASFGEGFGFGPPPFARGFHGGPFGRLDPAEIEQRADRMVRHLAIEIDATTEQQEKLRGIVKATLADVLPMRDKLRTARETGRDLLLAEKVDHAALEKLRADQIALADAASKRITQGLGEAADVLTPEQRRRIGDRMPMFGFRHGWSRG
ncbi:Putative membrane-anchored protein [Rhodovulum sp. PH10]|uniref:Spy/CpxP family protein refolding chaperone n=1 Tax=Rhodovulum sp. PH10 TaxID=1187851 RepID=UPI00027C285E|nr:Spy/CpxP family protein refolding chaperone [Rhodovulum sp. PH10]EJW13455.1 Putative membrane-anchored protein [Rhodovulum sp. PH10]